MVHLSQPGALRCHLFVVFFVSLLFPLSLLRCAVFYNAQIFGAKLQTASRQMIRYAPSSVANQMCRDQNLYTSANMRLKITHNRPLFFFGVAANPRSPSRKRKEIYFDLLFPLYEYHYQQTVKYYDIMKHHEISSVFPDKVHGGNIKFLLLLLLNLLNFYLLICRVLLWLWQQQVAQMCGNALYCVSSVSINRQSTNQN